MAKGTVVYVDGGQVGLNTDGKKDKDGKLIVDKVLKDCKGVPVTINGNSTNKRVADVKPDDDVKATETGGKVTAIVVTRK